jgi:HEPN domain-containing protein
LPRPEEIEVADLFLNKAGSDLMAARSLARDGDQDDDVVGFHAQQVVKKALKAVVAARGIEIPRSHDLVLLIGLVGSGGEVLPDEIREAGWLNPWAVTMRYDQVASALDRDLAVRVAEICLNWATDRVSGVRADPDSSSASGV